MNPNDLLGGAALVGFVAATWQQLKSLAMRMLGLLVVRATVSGPIVNNFQEYLWKNLKPSTTGIRNFRSFFVHVRPLDCHTPVVGERITNDGVLFWHRCWPIMVSAPSNDPAGLPVLRVVCLRWTFDTEAVLSALSSVSRWQGHKMERFAVYRIRGAGSYKDRELQGNKDIFNRPTGAGNTPGGNKAEPESPRQDSLDDVKTTWRLLRWKSEDLGEPVVVVRNAMETLVYPPAVVEIAEEITRWLASRQWHAEKNIPWRRGWNIIGPPGTGKTSLVRAVAQDNNLPIFSLDLGSMNNRELVDQFDQMRSSVPCVVAMEDLDNVFHGRTNVLGENGGGLSFDCLLNCMGGIERTEGMFFIVTTNHPEHLDPALGVPEMRENEVAGTISTRPGRLDRAIYLGKIDEPCRRKLAAFILSDTPEHVEELVRIGNGDTPAQFQFRCAQLASKLFWEKKNTNLKLAV